MSKETRELVQKVIDNLKTIEKEPLIFSDESGHPSNLGIKKKIKDGMKDDSLLREILAYKDNYYSRSQTSKNVETEPRKHRSVLDIWRHFIFYKPETTLFDMMSLIYSIKSELRYQYCNVIHKRVFDLQSSYAGHYQQDATHLDEFKLTFSQWEDINIEGESNVKVSAKEVEEDSEEEYYDQEEEDTNW
jgi:hypothetical protein